MSKSGIIFTQQSTNTNTNEITTYNASNVGEVASYDEARTKIPSTADLHEIFDGATSLTKEELKETRTSQPELNLTYWDPTEENTNTNMTEMTPYNARDVGEVASFGGARPKIPKSVINGHHTSNRNLSGDTSSFNVTRSQIRSRDRAQNSNGMPAGHSNSYETQISQYPDINSESHSLPSMTSDAQEMESVSSEARFTRSNSFNAFNRDNQPNRSQTASTEENDYITENRPVRGTSSNRADVYSMMPFQTLDSTEKWRGPHMNINAQIYSLPHDRQTSLSASNASLAADERMNYRDLHIFHEKAKEPGLAILDIRIASFDGWCKDHPLKPDVVARAGFYYLGYDDSCKCFFCGGGMRYWEPQDNPLVEHAYWYPKCGYIRQYLGEDFVQIVQEMKACKENITYQKVEGKMKEKGLTIENLFDDTPVESDPAVRALLLEGYDSQKVLKAASELRKRSEQFSVHAIRSIIDNDSQRKITALAVMAQNEKAEGSTAGNTGQSVDKTAELKEENFTLRHNLICKICMDKEIRMVFLPCGHLIACQECSVAILDCPVCRRHIRATVRALLFANNQ